MLYIGTNAHDWPSIQRMSDAKRTRQSTFGTAAYGGEGWSQRVRTHAQDLGCIWQSCGIDSEWRELKSVLLHVPGQELMVANDGPDSVQMLASMDVSIAIHEHDSMAQLYRSQGVNVHLVNPDNPCQPNQMLCADLFAMTPQGAILARPASTVRAGEERWIARRLASLGMPILKTITGTGTFEGSDLMWIDETTSVRRRTAQSRCPNSSTSRSWLCTSPHGKRHGKSGERRAEG